MGQYIELVIILPYSVCKGKNPLHKQFEKAYMCFKMRRASTRDFTKNCKIILYADWTDYSDKWMTDWILF